MQAGLRLELNCENRAAKYDKVPRAFCRRLVRRASRDSTLVENLSSSVEVRLFTSISDG
ncbi:hypothetical protein OESDEN_19617 [Oesophagostomum dentatum]|uniref:Uncharacterized protein n=1 Tax=Oesophagostomum dentatum TaxID=61180 RepID=A0A0B1S703_OESDE|nr:hypothetical protein OESDEN_19617 [Oesophagostomum dentatum]